MTTTPRTATVSRATSESSIELSLDLDGTGIADIQTSVPFYDHMLTAFAKHSLTDLTVRATGDTEIDVHHTVEDTAIVLGQALVMASAVFHAVSIGDLIIWGVIGIIFQVLVYYAFEKLTPFKVADELMKGNIAVGVFSARLSFATGLILAALIS